MYAKAPILALLLLLPPAVFAASDPGASAVPADKPELRGMIVTGSEQRFLLASAGNSHATWVGVGDSVGDWKISAYRVKDGTLLLQNAGGGELELTMANSTVQAGGDAKGTLADAQKLFEKMHMAEMLTKMLAQQKKLLSSQFMKGLNQYQGNATPEEMAAFKQQVLDKLFSGFDSQKLTDNLAQIYSQEFSSDQLQDLATFYDSPTGQAAIAKMPEIGMKQQQLLLPQLQAVIPQVTQMEKDFAAQHQAAPASPAAAATSHP